MDYFLLKYQLNKIERYLIWMSNDVDRVAVDASGELLNFPDLEAANRYVKQQGWTLYEDTAFPYNFDEISEWVNTPSAETIDCKIFLNTWNLFGDIANSVQEISFEDRNELADHVYDKLFWGNNLPSVTPVGKHYEPIWTADEVVELRRIMGDGLNQFVEHLSEQN